MLVTDWRVGDVPIITGSSGKTRIFMPGAIISSGSRQVRSNKNQDQDNHQGSFGVVYMNDLARGGLNAQPATQFPQGSIIVREKLVKADDVKPQHLVIMIKRTRGFNPAANDWEFLAVDGALTKVQERHKKGSCFDCHVSQRATDFVYPLPQQ